MFLVINMSRKRHVFIIGIVSNDGQYPSAHSFDQDQLLAIGPMCRYAQDLSLGLKIMADKNADLLKLNQKVDISKIKASRFNIKIKILNYYFIKSNYLIILFFIRMLLQRNIRINSLSYDN